MDYIYKGKDGKKKVGEIRYIEELPYYEFELQIDGNEIMCYLQHLTLEWEIYLSNCDKLIELAHPTDVYWNIDAINESINNEETSLQIAYAIKEIYMKRCIK